MAYLLDTNALSEFLKKTPNESVIDWFGQVDEQQQYVSTLTIGEIQKGIAKLTASHRKDELQSWFDQVITRYYDRILPVTLETAKTWGDLVATLESKGRVFPVIDSLLAATALEHSLTIVTRNESDFDLTGAKILNIWAAQQ